MVQPFILKSSLLSIFHNHIPPCIIAIAKNLYLDDKYMVEMECKSTLVDGTCPRDQAAFFVYAREHEASRALRTKIIKTIDERTHGCFDVSVVMAEENRK